MNVTRRSFVGSVSAAVMSAGATEFIDDDEPPPKRALYIAAPDLNAVTGGQHTPVTDCLERAALSTFTPP